MTVQMANERTVAELVERHQALYESAEVEARLRAIIREAPQSKLADWDVHRILRAAKAVFFDTHVEVVSGHHTATYLDFGAIARVPQLMRLLERDMSDWIRQTFKQDRVDGIIATASDAEQLAEGIAELLHRDMRLRVVLTPFDRETGKIGTDVMTGVIRSGERFVVLNDVTTRGNCVNKLGQVVVGQGGVPAGMMVFARRDSGQFPLMADLAARFPFYWTADLDMPQWEPADCPLCAKKPLLSWKDIPEL